MLTPTVRPMTRAELMHARTTRRVRESILLRPARLSPLGIRNEDPGAWREEDRLDG